MQSDMKKGFVFVLSMMLLTVGFTGCKYFKSVDGPGMERDSADIAAMDSMAMKAKEDIAGLIKELYAAASQNASDIDQRFACHAWRDTVAAVEKKDANLPEIGFFNDDYWTMMQDSNPSDLEARDIKFEQLDVEKGRATVDYTLYSSVQTVHQKLRFCREDGDWRVHDIIRFYTDSDGKEVQSSLMKSMQDYLSAPQEEASELELNYTNIDGVYDSLDEDMNSVSRISLNADGTATWCMVGSLNYTEYTYRIEGNTICMKAKGVDSEEECYEYDSDTRTLKNEQGAVFYRQVVD
jgi:hypothetical protein